MPVSASRAKAPPASTASSWWWSPTSSTFAPAGGGLVDEGVEGGGAGQGRLVDHEQVPRAQRVGVLLAPEGAAGGVQPVRAHGVPPRQGLGVPVVQVGQAGGAGGPGGAGGLVLPLGGVLTRHPQRGAELVGGGRRRRQPAAPTRARTRPPTRAFNAVRVVVLPVPAGPTRTSTSRPEAAICCTAATWSAASRTPCPGRLPLPPSRSDGPDEASLAADGVGGDRRGGGGGVGGEQAVLGVEDGGGGVGVLPGPGEHAGPVAAAVPARHGDGVGRVQGDAVR